MTREQRSDSTAQDFRDVFGLLSGDSQLRSRGRHHMGIHNTFSRTAATSSRGHTKRLVAFLALAIGFAACGSSTDDDARSVATAPTRTTTTPSPTANAMEGTWRTEAITVDDMTRTLRDHDLAKWVRRFEKNAPIGDAPTRLILELRDGDWNLSGEPQGGAPEGIDTDSRYEIDGDRIVASHEGDSNTYRWSVRGDSLTLTWQKTSYGPYKGCT